MNSKMIAIAAVAVLIASGAALVLAAPSDAEGTGASDSPVDLGTVVLNITDEADTTDAYLKFNEGAYSSYYKYEFTIYAGADASTATNSIYSYSDSSGSITERTIDNNLKVTGVSPVDSTPGYYKITIGEGGTSSASDSIYFKVAVTVYPDEANNSLKVDLNPFYYKVNVIVRQTQVITLEGTASFIQNVHGSVTLAVRGGPFGTSVTADDLKWYAIGLPAGLSVGGSEGGVVISGMTTASSGGEVKIVGRDASGVEYAGTVTVNVTSATQSIKLKLTVGPDDSPVVNDDDWKPQDLVVKQNDTVTLEVSGNGFSEVSVNVIRSDGTRDNPTVSTTESSKTFTIPTDGVGTYTVEIITGGDYETFTLHVVPAITGSDAGFVIIPTGS